MTLDLVPPPKRMKGADVMAEREVFDELVQFLNGDHHHFGIECDELPDFTCPKGAQWKELRETKILVVGAGGLGCEVLKTLAFCGFKCIEVIDMDTVSLTNLNRQFLFREEDIGKYKSVVAAEAINRRLQNVTGVHVTPHTMKVQDKPLQFYKQFGIVVAGLDNVEARDWLNEVLHDVLRFSPEGELDFSTVRWLIDGGSEGLAGQCRVILTSFMPCFRCTIKLSQPAKQTFPMCTMVSTPRKPEHCIQYVITIEWGNKNPFGGELDTDNPDHMKWVFERSVARAGLFKIQGVTEQFTNWVVKSTVPAVSSTNSIIASSCALEALKAVTRCGSPVDNNLYYNQVHSVWLTVDKYEQEEGCEVCGALRRPISGVGDSSTLQDLVNKVQEVISANCEGYTLSNLFDGVPIYCASGPLKTDNLTKSCKTLFPLKSELILKATATKGLSSPKKYFVVNLQLTDG
eukprot:GHVN01063918.1.p1 GENE.GHVN01063918.1~~GHVN01063918.1.p1  ORF type:complete len:460 (+),score=74.72 GHVN01063918.1:45-1424(+)